MRQPRPHDFDPKYSKRSAEEINMDGVVPIRDNFSPPPASSTTIYTEIPVTPAAIAVAPSASYPLPPTTISSTPATPAPTPSRIMQPQQSAPQQTTQQPGIQEMQPSTQPESNIAILQFSEDQIADLREPAFKAQTFRLTESEIEWLKDQSYQMSKQMKRGKVSQVDIVRVALKLFANGQAANASTLVDVLQRIK